MAAKRGSANRAKIKKEAFETIRDRLSKHQLLPGSKLLEHDLAKEFHISRAHVREILGSLEERGLIVRIPNRGALVAYLDAPQAMDLYYVREALEALSARLAAERAPKGTWDALNERLGPAIREKLRRGDYDEYEEILAQVNRRIVEQAQCLVLTDMLDRIRDRTEAIGRRIIVLHGRAEVGFELHRKLLKALIAGDPDEAARIKGTIISTARDLITRYKEFIF